MTRFSKSAHGSSRFHLFGRREILPPGPCGARTQHRCVIGQQGPAYLDLSATKTLELF